MVLGHGEPHFQVLDYEAASAMVFPLPTAGADLVHAWTPREHVHKMTLSLVRV